MVTRIGTLSNTVAAQLILDNTYDFSGNWDQATIDLLRAAACLRLEIEDLPHAQHGDTTKELQSF